MRHVTVAAIVVLAAVACVFTAGCQREMTAQDYYQKSFQFINAGSIQDAIDLLTLAIDKDPAFFEAYYNRGVMYFCQEKYQKALDDFNIAVSLNGSNAGAYAGRGTVYDRLKRHSEAIQDFKVAARLGDADTQGYLRSKGIEW